MSLKVFAIGDLHGRFQPIRDFHLRHNTNKEYNKANKYMILLGDAGLNYYLDSRDKTFKKKLSKYPFTYFVIRGNHEERASNIARNNPDWQFESFWGNLVLVEKEFPNIKYAMDYPTFYAIPYVKIPYFLRDDNPNTGDIEHEDLIDYWKTWVIPGAYSVDKDYRLTMGYSWFKDEQLTEEEKDCFLHDMSTIGYDCDFVLSHTCPCCFEPTDLFLPMVDQSTVDKSMEQFLEHVEFLLDYKCWLWGHYHTFRDYPRTDGTKKIMLMHEVIDLEQVYKEDTVELL